MEQGRNAVATQVVFLTLLKARSGSKTHRRRLVIRAGEFGIADSSEERLLGPARPRGVPFCAAPLPRILTDISYPGDPLGNNARIGAPEKMPQIENVHLPVATEDLITPLPIKEHGNSGLSRRPHHAPLRVYACSADRLVLMPNQAIQVVPKTSGLRENIMRSGP